MSPNLISLEQVMRWDWTSHQISRKVSYDESVVMSVKMMNFGYYYNALEQGLLKRFLSTREFWIEYLLKLYPQAFESFL